MFGSISKLSTLVDNPLWAEFKIYELTEIMRQRDDLTFAQALSHIPSGNLTVQEIEMFKKRSFKTASDLPVKARSAVNLFQFNKDVAFFNEAKLNAQFKLPGVVRINSVARDIVKGTKTAKQKNSALASVQCLAITETNGLPHNLILQTGSLYMITTNVDVSDGLFNGAIGTLERVDIKNAKPHIAWMKFKDERIGAQIRSNYLRKGKDIQEKDTSKNNFQNLVPILKINRQINRPSSCQYQVSSYIEEPYIIVSL